MGKSKSQQKKNSALAISKKNCLLLLKNLLLPRLIEEKMLKLLRQGQISKWFSGIGQEAISVGCALALHPHDTIFTLHRNLGVFTSREIPLRRLFAQWQGKEEGFTNGRDRSFHFGAPEFNIIGMISHLGAQLSFACGAALAYKLKSSKQISLVFTGEGGTSQGEFHEALNVAAVWSLPVIFVIENNGYGLSTPSNEQYKCKNLADKAIGYGIESVIIDGNNVVEVFKTIKKIARKIRKDPKPILVECKTFRIRGHEEASGVKYVPKKLIEKWSKKDPIQQYKKLLLDHNLISEESLHSMSKSLKDYIDTELEIAKSYGPMKPDLTKEQSDIYAPSIVSINPVESKLKNLRMVDSISEALDQAMTKFPNLILMGQDIAEYGGVFKVTEGLVEKYGKDRVRNTPLCESAIVGIALGLNLEGHKSMVEMQFADFVTCGFNQIVNNLAKISYRWNGNADTVIRMPTGGAIGAGPFHSQCTESWFTHVPGLKIVYPSNSHDAKGLLLASFEDPNPILYYEHKALYRSISDDVPEDYFIEEIGKAKVIHRGTQATIITYGMGVHWSKEIVAKNKFDVEIIDLRTLVPLDSETIRNSISKTNKAIILHEDTKFGSYGAEISSTIAETMFDILDAPILRVGSLDTPVPFAKELEEQFLPKDRFERELFRLLNY